MKRILVFISYTLLLLKVNIQGFSQGVLAIPPSQNSEALMRYGELPVSFYTGLPEIAIPLYTLPGKKLQVPISLNYHASGIKVNDLGGNVGLGWALNAGGVVTRVVRGIPDESYYGFCGAGNIGRRPLQLLNQEQVSFDFDAYKGKLDSNIYDGEPDVFYYNLPGASGKFILNTGGVPMLIPKNQGVKIIPGVTIDGVTEFIIITMDGTKYYFGHDQNSRETTTVKDSQNKTIVPGYTSSWYMDKIISVEGDEVVFDYEDDGTESAYIYDHSKYEYLYTSISIQVTSTHYDVTINENTPLPSIPSTISKSKLTVNTNSKRLRRILTSNGFIYFNASTKTRQFSTGHFIDKISVFNNVNSNKLLKEFQLEFKDDLNGRVFLSSVIKKNEEEGNENYLLEYNVLALPAPYANSQDHWGYFNNNTLDHLIPSTSYIDRGTLKTYSGADREPNEDKMQAGILKKITNPYGGYTEFEFEAHRYFDSQTQSNKIAGGLRIKKIRQSDGVNNQNILDKAYYYNIKGDLSKSSGLNLSTFNYSFPLDYHTIIYLPNGGKRIDENFYLYRKSTSTIDIATQSGSSVGYSCVEENMGDLGKNIYTFSDYNDYPDFLVSGNGNSTTYQSSSTSVKSVSPRSSREVCRGLLKELSTYYKNDKLKRRITYVRGINSSGETVAMRCSRKAFFLSADPLIIYVYGNIITPYDVYFYKEFEVSIYLVNVIEENFEYKANGDAQILTKNIFYDYENKFGLVKAITEVGSDLRQIVKLYIYPHDYKADIAPQMVSRLMGLDRYALPIEEVTFLVTPEGKDIYMSNSGGKEVISGQLNVYDNISGLLRERKNLEIETPIARSTFSLSNEVPSGFFPDSRYKRKIKYESYDEYKNVTQISSEEGTPESYIWGYNSSSNPGSIVSDSPLPIAKVSNAEECKIAHTSFEVLNDKRLKIESPSGLRDGKLPSEVFFSGIISKTVPCNTCQYKVSVFAKGKGSLVFNNNFQNAFAVNEDSKWVEIIFPFQNLSNISIQTIDQNENNKVYIDNISLIVVSDNSYIAFTDFEDLIYGGWSYPENGIKRIYTSAKTGSKFYTGTVRVENLDVCTTTSGDIEPYKLSFWASGVGTIDINDDPALSINNTSESSWIYHELVLTSNQAKNLKINSLHKKNPAGEVSIVYLDELRLHPLNAQMTTYTYEPLVGMTSETNINNVTTYYEYDKIGRLKLVRDQDGNIVKKHKYNIKRKD